MNSKINWAAAPAVLKSALLGNLPPQVRLYLHMLGRSGRPMRLPPALRNDADNTLTRITERTTGQMYSPEPGPRDFSYPLQTAYALGQDPDELVFDRTNADRNWAQSLGTFTAKPLGRDSVSVYDRYDFRNDLGQSAGQLQHLIRLAQLLGKPFDVRDTVYAPTANRAIDSTRAVQQTWRKHYLANPDRYQ